MVIVDGIIFSLQRAGGISVYFRELIEALGRDKIETSVVLEESLKQKISGGANVSLIRREARFLERYRDCRVPKNTSVYHSSYYRLPSLCNLPTVVTVHDFIYEHYQHGFRKWIHSAQKNAAIRAAQAVICVSESTKQDLLELVGETPEQEIYVIHNGVSNVFQKTAMDSAPIPFVLFIGQRGGYKNFKLILDAMSFLPDIELHCVGGGKIHADELGTVPYSVACRVKHLGFVTDEELNIIYNRALCLAYPSSYEGFGIPVIEAMRAGCPVVCTNCKAVLEVGREALTVVSDSEPESMALAILSTASSERLSLIQKGITVSQDYSWEKTHRQTLDVYRSLGA
jgi:mannosyltransferase